MERDPAFEKSILDYIQKTGFDPTDVERKSALQTRADELVSQHLRAHALRLIPKKREIDAKYALFFSQEKLCVDALADGVILAEKRVEMLTHDLYLSMMDKLKGFEFSAKGGDAGEGEAKVKWRIAPEMDRVVLTLSASAMMKDISFQELYDACSGACAVTSAALTGASERVRAEITLNTEPEEISIAKIRQAEEERDRIKREYEKHRDLYAHRTNELRRDREHAYRLMFIENVDTATREIYEEFVQIMDSLYGPESSYNPLHPSLG